MENCMHPSDQAQKFVIRLPNDVKAFIADQARRNGSSQNSEVIRAIRDRMDQAVAKPDGR
ncbi:Arc family DNA-binding protein [Microvirga aerophila]|uniref:Arc family DNA-binding protein n=1 Tax=Microvirga aerophila TaxID=670291 RepID=UPI0035A24B9C